MAGFVGGEIRACVCGRTNTGSKPKKIQNVIFELPFTILNLTCYNAMFI